ncbi:MAG: lactate dehydrogenase [Rhodospirillales bacterium]|nr:lactate dehydrogenase [Acetobacter sp.]
MRIAFIGATGAVGSALLIHLLKSSLLKPGDEIVLAGRGTPESHARLLAIRTDLLDAFDEAAVQITVCASLEKLCADICIVAAGITPASPDNRQDLAVENLPFFEDLAQRLAAALPQAFFLVVSNPVELAVAAFCRHLDRHRVMGMGAQQDSLRFARAVAAKLGVHRSTVRASVFGEHGEWMLPMWSSVYLTDASEEQTACLRNLQAAYEADDTWQTVRQTRQAVMQLVQSGSVAAAYSLLEEAAPEVKILIEPIVTFKLLRSTPNATANATLDCLSAFIAADERKLHGQVLLQGEFYGITGVCGIPLCLRRSGWHMAAADPLTEAEAGRLRRASTAINASIEEVYRRLFPPKS